MERPDHNSTRRPAVAVLAVAVLTLIACFGLAWWLWPRASARKPPEPTAAHLAPNSRAAAPAADGNTSSDPIVGRVLSTLAALKSTANPAERRQSLSALRNALTLAGTNRASIAIRGFLDTKADAPTRLGFKVGGDGFLGEAPSLRVFLLDLLGQMDPAAAAEYARGILSRPDSPDEWAVALRNLALGDATALGKALLAQKTAELLRNTSWQRDPSAGYLEAFDTAVYLGGTALMPELTDLVRQRENPAVAHAAFLTLDRLVIGQPAAALAALAASPERMSGRESTRADYFARADVRDSRQRQVLETYLLDSKIGAAELDHFAGVYPNANFLISRNLLTRSETLEGAALLQRDKASLQAVQEWLEDARFAGVRPHLEKLRRRLQAFVQEASTR